MSGGLYLSDLIIINNIINTQSEELYLDEKYLYNFIDKSRFKLNVHKETYTDTELRFIPIQTNMLFDCIIKINSPTVKFYDIILSPFVTIPVNNFDIIKKGDNPFDFMVTDSQIINNENAIVMKSLGRSFNYFSNKSEEYNKPLGVVDEYKPITQDIVKIKTSNNFYCLKVKPSRNINLSRNWVDGIFSVIYTNNTYNKCKKYDDLISKYHVNNIKRYGITKSVLINSTLEPNTITVMSFWIKINLECVWFFKLESSSSSQLLIDDKILIENYNLDTNGTNKYAEYKMSEGFYKFIIRSENIGKNSICNLSFLNYNTISWQPLTNDNLSDFGNIYSYIPIDMSLYHLNGLINTPLNDKMEIPNVDYIFINSKYYSDFYNAILNDCTNVKSIGTPVSDSSDIYYTLSYIKDDISINPVGWANNTTKNNGVTYVGYKFNSDVGITNFIMIDWFEYDDYGIKTDNILKILNDPDTKSKIVKLKIIYLDDSEEFISYNMVDTNRCKNISINSKYDYFFKTSTTGQTIIRLKNPITKPIKYVLIYRWDNIKKYWGIITEINVYIKDYYNILDEVFLIDAYNTEYSIMETPIRQIPAFGFYSIPLDNKTQIHKADIEKVSKSTIITLYTDNNEYKIKYNMIMR